MKRFSLILITIIAQVAFAEVEFRALDLSEKDELLFTARTDLPGRDSYDTLFLADLAKGSLRQLSCYPEEAALLDDGSILQIQNRFGVFRLDLSKEGPEPLKPVEGFPSFTRGSQIQEGKILTAGASPDGKWLLYVVPETDAYGRLMLLDVTTGKDTTVAQGMEYSISRFPAAWSLDSGWFVYEKASRLYYYSIDQFRGKRVAPETIRSIGEGKINTVRWSRDNRLYYIRENLLYRVTPEELFTRTLYTGLIPVGRIVGKLPFPYDLNFDSFYVSPDGGKILFNKEGRNLFMFYVNPDDYTDSGKTASLPYLFLPGSTTVLSVMWPESDVVTIVTNRIENGERSLGAFRLEVPKDRSGLGLAQSFRPLETNGAKRVAISPNQALVALVADDGVSVRRYDDWSPVKKLSHDKPLAVLWKNDDEVVVAGAYAIHRWKLAEAESRFLALAQAPEYGFAREGGVTVRASGTAFRSREDWSFERAQKYEPVERSNARETKRVYLDSVQAGTYKNAIMVRSVSGLGTTQLILPQSRRYAAFPERDEERMPDLFDHGSRIRRREIALVFNLVDSPAGITTILNTLKDYGIVSTFFVNGEFIRRNQGAVREIAASGHEIGSMFFAAFDMTDARFRVDTEFVRRGLARNEDDYFAATGRELSLLWHAPDYAVSGDLVAAGASMNYTYVGRDVDPMDWVGKYDSFRIPGSYFPAHKIVERIMERKKPGSIVPIRVGIPEGGRQDYLFNELDLLINALIREGYSIVPVTTLMEHVK